MPRFLPLARRLAALAAPLALAVGALPVQAGDLPQQAQTQGQDQTQVQDQIQGQVQQDGEVGGFSQEVLQSYAAAVLKVQEVDSAWQPRLQEAESAEEIEAMTRQATDEMVGEIEAQGLSVGQYNSITKAAEQDDQLYDHIMTLLAQAR